MSKNSSNGAKKTDKFEALLKKAGQFVSEYHIVLEESKNLGFIGSSIEMPNVYADGRTPDECVKAVKEALQVAVASLLEQGKRAPVAFSPKRRNVQVNVRLNQEEKNLFQKAAKTLGFRGISDFVRNCALERVRSVL